MDPSKKMEMLDETGIGADLSKKAEEFAAWKKRMDELAQKTKKISKESLPQKQEI